MLDSEIKSLIDLNKFRTAPNITSSKQKELLDELIKYMRKADWFTIGIMAPSPNSAIITLREVEFFFNWQEMIIINQPNIDSPVFLKANQKTNNVYVRTENGLGEGILISCQKDSEQNNTQTFGPLPLSFFSGETSIRKSI